MSSKTIILSLFCFIAATAAAQSVNITFPDEGPRQIWVASSLPQSPPGDTDGMAVTKNSASLPVAGQKDDASVYIWDKRTGNLASKSLKAIGGKPWAVKPSDFTNVAEVTVQVVHDGKALAAAMVDVDDGRRKVSQLLVPASNGLLKFFGIKPGSLKITVHYKVGGADAAPVVQLIDVPLTRPYVIPSPEISLAAAVDTVGQAPATTGSPSPSIAPGDTGQPSTTGQSAAPTSGTGKESKEEPESAGGVAGRVLIYLIVLGAMVAAVYFALMYAKKNPDSLGSKLEQLGVQIPKPGSDPLADPSQISAPTRSTPTPVQKIILDDAAPDPVVQTSAAVPLVQPAQPQLVSATGDAMPLPEGELVVGRDVGLGLSLVGESTVSRRHAQLARNGGQVTVTDLGSTNGTYVNGVQLQGEKQLQNGDAVQFGSVRFRYEG